MFTGLIEELGEILAIRQFDGGIELDISAEITMADLAIDHSISVNGACQTVVRLTDKSFTVQAIRETLDKTTFKTFSIGDKVNLERAMKAQDRLGGHFVQGHVNGVGKLVSVEHRGENKLLGIELSDVLAKYCIKEGSITVDGISLTIAEIKQNLIYLSIIPHTWKVTNLALKKLPNTVNIEVDMMAKYIHNYLDKINLSKSV